MVRLSCTLVLARYPNPLGSLAGSAGCVSHLCCIMSPKTQAPCHWAFPSPLGAVNIFSWSHSAVCRSCRSVLLIAVLAVRRCIKYNLCLCVRAALNIVIGCYNFQSVEPTPCCKTPCQKGSSSSVCLLRVGHLGWNAAWTLVRWCHKLQIKCIPPIPRDTSARCTPQGTGVIFLFLLPHEDLLLPGKTSYSRTWRWTLGEFNFF